MTTPQKPSAEDMATVSAMQLDNEERRLDRRITANVEELVARIERWGRSYAHDPATATTTDLLNAMRDLGELIERKARLDGVRLTREVLTWRP